MMRDRIGRVVADYHVALQAHTAERRAKCRLCHVRWMLGQMGSFLRGEDEAQWEKANRWLGFIQGVLWCEGVYTIDEMREHNRL
jgi:hypothetical protein